MSKDLGNLEGKANGIMDRLNKKKGDKKTPKKQDNNSKQDDKEDKKVNRSYMLSKDVLSKLNEMKIKQPTKNYSEIVEEAIKYLYKNSFS